MGDEILLRALDRRVPRYTSYPTAPHFTGAIGASTYARWLAVLPSEALVSLYLHVPFCRSLCWFCGCQAAVVNRPEPVAAYARLLIEEIAMVARAIGGKRRIGRIHWGGGTPTIVGADDMRAIMEAVRDAFDVMPDVDLAVEIDPRQFSSGMAETLAALGVNRASLGVQDIDPDVQQAIGRNQPLAATVVAAEALRENGVQRFAVDLIVGLPRQTEDGVRRTVELVDDAVSPGRVAAFSYAHVPWMKPHQRLIDDTALPDGRGRVRLARAAAGALKDRGFVAVGFDHFARPGDALAAAAASGRLRRTFQGYTDDAADVLLGFGSSAIGTLPQGYVQNSHRVPQYRRAVEAGTLATSRGIELTGPDRMRREVIERLMCDFKVDLAATARRWGSPVEVFAEPLASLELLRAEGLIDIRDSSIVVHEEGRLAVRVVAAAFDRYLETGAARHSLAS